VVHVDQLLQVNPEHLSLRVLRLAVWMHLFPQFSGRWLRLQGNSRPKNNEFHQDLCMFYWFFRIDYFMTVWSIASLLTLVISVVPGLLLRASRLL
jgi:hypothetical protein